MTLEGPVGMTEAEMHQRDEWPMEVEEAAVVLARHGLLKMSNGRAWRIDLRDTLIAEKVLEGEKLRAELLRAKAKIAELDDETGYLRAAFMKAHCGHCEGPASRCWMLQTYESSLSRAERDHREARPPKSGREVAP